MIDANDWQPIGTAPKDGATILLWEPYDKQQIGIGWKWENDLFWEGGQPQVWETPTHWMPLPKPPSPL